MALFSLSFNGTAQGWIERGSWMNRTMYVGIVHTESKAMDLLRYPSDIKKSWEDFGWIFRHGRCMMLFCKWIHKVIWKYIWFCNQSSPHVALKTCWKGVEPFKRGTKSLVATHDLLVEQPSLDACCCCCSALLLPGQSTNDSYPTSAKLACILMHSELLNAIKNLSKSSAFQPFRYDFLPRWPFVSVCELWLQECVRKCFSVCACQGWQWESSVMNYILMPCLLSDQPERSKTKIMVYIWSWKALYRAYFRTTDLMICLCCHKITGKTFFKKAEEFADVVKMGRTQLQDAVPMRLGQQHPSVGKRACVIFVWQKCQHRFLSIILREQVIWFQCQKVPSSLTILNGYDFRATGANVSLVLHGFSLGRVTLPCKVHISDQRRHEPADSVKEQAAMISDAYGFCLLIEPTNDWRIWVAFSDVPE